MPVRNERRSLWTWGYVSDEPTDEARRAAAKALSGRLGAVVEPPPAPRIEDIELRAPRIAVPDKLRDWVSQDHVERVTHTHGGHPLELLAALRGEFQHPPDAVAHPRNEDELEATLAWCDAAGCIAIPYGGGTTVVWGVNVPATCERAVTIDLDHLNGVLEIDPVSRAGRFQAGLLGPDLEAALKPHDLTLRHFPQSFPWSTVGGWVATRSGGHYATNHTHIDDFVESTRMLTPAGWFESRRLPGSGAGPSPDRLVIGSEGILGIISECWLRLQKRPRFRATAGVTFDDWASGTEAVRHVVQAKLWPANLRILDPVEAGMNAGLDGRRSLVIIGFESADIPQGPNLQAALAIARACGGQVGENDIAVDDGHGEATGRGGAVGAWRNAFIGVNAGLTIGLGLLADTFETACTWDRWPAFDAAVRERVGRVLRETMGASATLACRFTHVYPDGPAPYYSFSGVVPRGGEQEAWAAIKAEATAAVVEAGGTVTHHHAVGRMHAAGWARQRPPLFGEVLRAAKRTLDPNGILNPGVLLEA
ncbi:MAG: FAD-binding oxidoreductase [Gammaproteobacteria bacterium]|nr:FAD-binding oxidoreductase [Gammaproteobacteria bacterium]